MFSSLMDNRLTTMLKLFQTWGMSYDNTPYMGNENIHESHENIHESHDLI